MKRISPGSERVRFRELAQEVIADYRDNRRATVGDVERRIRLYLEPVFGNVRAADFSTGQIRHYIADRRKAGASNATINRELAVVKRAFHLAAQNDPPMVVRVPHIPMLEEKNVRKGFLEHEPYCRLLDELPIYLRPLLVVGYYVGCRVGELLQIQWPEVDLVAKRIRLEPGTTKGDEGRTLPIYNGEMLEWLKMSREVKEARYPECSAVFHREGGPIRSFKNAWASACARAGVPELLFHDLRRTAVRNMVRAGIPEKIAMQISGHKTRSVFDRYNIVSDRDLDLAAERMERHFERMGTISGTIADSTESDASLHPHKLLN